MLVKPRTRINLLRRSSTSLKKQLAKRCKIFNTVMIIYKVPSTKISNQSFASLGAMASDPTHFYKMMWSLIKVVLL